MLTYTGNGSSQSITGLGFTPGLVWVKGRNQSESHCLTDVVRGDYWMLRSDLDNADSQYGNVGIHSLTSGGFSVGSGSAVNQNSINYVAWCWKAGGTPVSNTDGSITSSVSANTAFGFSVVTYIGTGSNATVGHGLGKAPDLIIIKNRDTSLGDAWRVWASALAANERLVLSGDNTVGSDPTLWQNTLPSSSVFYLRS